MSTVTFSPKSLYHNLQNYECSYCCSSVYQVDWLPGRIPRSFPALQVFLLAKFLLQNTPQMGEDPWRHCAHPGGFNGWTSTPNVEPQIFSSSIFQCHQLHYNTTTIYYTILVWSSALHFTTLNYTSLQKCGHLHYTTLHYTTLHCTTLHYTTLHYTWRGGQQWLT